jgi:hypothetical protein
MAMLDWTTTYNAVVAALVGADGPDLAVGTSIRDALNAWGTPYSATWSPFIDTAKGVYTTALAADVSAWSATVQGIAHDADRAAREAEGAQVTAQSGSPTPYVSPAGDVLAADKAIPFDATDAPTTPATLALLASSTPVLQLVAKDPGTPGNRVEARVLSVAGTTTTLATSGSPPLPVSGTLDLTPGLGTLHLDTDPSRNITTVRFTTPTTRTLQVRLGAGYSESYDVAAPGAALDVSSSRLLASATWYPGASQPDATSWVSLSGGTGGCVPAVRARIAKALALPAAGAQLATLQAYASAIDPSALPPQPTAPAATDSTAPYAATPVAYQASALAGTLTGIYTASAWAALYPRGSASSVVQADGTVTTVTHAPPPATAYTALALEQALTPILADATAWLAVVGF